MSDPETDSNPGLLSEFFLGPAWARAGSTPQIFKPRPESDKRRDDGPPRRGEGPPRRDERSREPRDRDDRRPGQGRRGPYQDRRDAPPEPQEIGPAPGVRVTLHPDRQAVHLIGKEIHQVARVYSLFDVAEILLAERVRCRALFEVSTTRPPLYHGRLDGSLFLTKEEAVRHLWNSEVTKQVLEEETIEVDPPTGRFNLVARCGLSGVWLGPPNHHSYQTNLRRLHRERFSHLPFEMYASKVRTERTEEAVAAWLETMKTKVRWRVIGEGDDAWMDDKAAAEHAVATRCFDKAYAEVRRVDIAAGIPAGNISPALFASLRHAGLHAKRNPAILIPAVCVALEAEHLPVFKRSGKLFTGPARPHALPRDVALAERPARIVEWIRNNKPAKLAGLWQAVHPTGGTEPCLEYANDLFWLLNQGHILLHADDTLIVQELRDNESPGPAEGKPGRRAKTKATPAGGPPKDSAPPASAPGDAPAPPEEAPAVVDETIPEEVPDGTQEPDAAEQFADAGDAPAATEEAPAVVAETTSEEMPDGTQEPDAAADTGDLIPETAMSPAVAEPTAIEQPLLEVEPTPEAAPAAIETPVASETAEPDPEPPAASATPPASEGEAAAPADSNDDSSRNGIFP